MTFCDYKSMFLLHQFVHILWFDSGLENICEHLREYERNSLSRKLAAVISNESDSKMIEGINENITRLLELFQASRFIASKAPYMLCAIVNCIGEERYYQVHYTKQRIECHGEARYSTYAIRMPLGYLR